MTSVLILMFVLGSCINDDSHRQATQTELQMSITECNKYAAYLVRTHQGGSNKRHYITDAFCLSPTGETK